MDFLTKSIQGGIKDVDLKSRRVKVAIASFDNIDAYGDIIMPGAFDKTISENGPKGKDRIRHFKNHDYNTTLGNPQEFFVEDGKLIMVSSLFTTQDGNDALTLYNEGGIKEHSIGYGVVKEDQRKDADGKVLANQLLEVKLWEGSSLTGWGANENTPFLGMKDLNQRINNLEGMLKTNGFSDERYIAMEAQFTELKEMIAALTQGFEPPKALDEKGQPLALSLKQVLDALRQS